jgi:hypothetical protein
MATRGAGNCASCGSLSAMGRTRRSLEYAASLPERGVRAAAAAAGGVLYESAQLLLPRLVRRSRFYEATARNALRIAIELVGGVEGATREPPDLGARPLAARKAAGNVVEIGSIAAFGFSPLWLLAAASDVLHGSRVYLDALVTELKNAGVLAEGATAATIDDLLAALEGASGGTARLIDVPPVELAELRRSLDELRRDARRIPSAAELARLFDGLRRQADAERVSLLELSSGIGLAFLVSTRRVGRAHLVDPYREDWRPLKDEGLAAYARRVAEPYRRALGEHLDPARVTHTERALRRRRARR